MLYFPNIVRDDKTLAPLSGVYVNVLDSTGEKASLLDADGLPIDNPIITNSLGDASFYVADADVYTQTYTYGGRTYRKDMDIIGVPEAFIGPPGPAYATYITLAAFKAGSITDKTQVLQDPAIPFGQFFWETVNAPYTADNVNIIKADSTPLSVGAWVRQETGSLTFQQAGTGATARTAQSKLREIVSVTDFGAVAGSSADMTFAFDAAVAALGSTGGVIRVPNGTFKVNVVVAQDNIMFVGDGGRGEFDRTVLRPYDLTKPTMTFGDDVTDWRYCGIENLHVSGADGTTGSDRQSAKSAPQALLLKGGTVNFKAINCVFYNGIQTVALVPSLTNPVTANTFLCCTIRNDLDDSADARSIYGIRQNNPDGGYWTANKFIATKVNGPVLGYAAEYDGTSYPILVEINDSYWDIKADHGILCKGSVTIVCYNWQVDPAASDVVIIESDQPLASGGITRLLLGIIRHGGQKVQFTDATLDLPDYAETYSYRSTFEETSLVGNSFLTTPLAPFDDTVFFGRVGANIMFSGAPVVADQGFSSNTDYRIAGTKIAGARQSGWTAMAGTATKGGFDTSTVTLPQLAQVVKALIDERLAAGSIGT